MGGSWPGGADRCSGIGQRVVSNCIVHYWGFFSLGFISIFFLFFVMFLFITIIIIFYYYC